MSSNKTPGALNPSNGISNQNAAQLNSSVPVNWNKRRVILLSVAALGVVIALFGTGVLLSKQLSIHQLTQIQPLYGYIGIAVGASVIIGGNLVYFTLKFRSKKAESEQETQSNVDTPEDANPSETEPKTEEPPKETKIEEKKKEEKAEVSKATAPSLSSSERVIPETYIEKLVQTMGSTREKALTLRSPQLIQEGKLCSNFKGYIDAIKKAVNEKDLTGFQLDETLRKDIVFCREVGGKLKDIIDFCGVATLNRSVLINPEVALKLSNPEMIIAIFSIAKMGESSPYFKDIFITRLNGGRSLTLASVLEFGLLDHPLIMETMPLNTINKTGIQGKREAYENQKNVENTLVPIYQGILTACSNLKIEVSKSNHESRLTNLSSETMASSLPGLFIFAKTHATIVNSERFNNFNGTSIEDFFYEAESGFKDWIRELEICETKAEKAPGFVNYALEEMTIDEFIRVISASHHLILPTISHRFDKLHLAAVLRNAANPNAKKWKFRDGELNLAQIFEKIAYHIGSGVTTGKVSKIETAFTAEQLAIRLAWIIDDFSKP